MALPSDTTRVPSGLSRSEAAIEAWKKRERAKPKVPGQLEPRIANRVREILAKRRKGKARVAPKSKVVDPEKAKAKADKVAATEKAKAERAGRQLSADVRRETAKRERETAKAEREQSRLEKVATAEKKQAQRQKQLKQAAKERKKEAIGKPATTDERAKKQGENRAKVAQEMADSDSGLSPSGSAALTAFADGAQLPKEIAGQLTTMGLLEQDSAGGQRLSYAGRATINAMNRGDTRAALDAISRAADRTKAKADSEQRKADADSEQRKADADKKRDVVKAERDNATAAREKDKAEKIAKDDASRARVEAARIEAARSRNRKAIEDTDMDEDTLDLEIKAGARHSRMDMQALQSIHDNSVACGASCGAEDDELDVDAEKAIKSIQDNPQWYAQHECGDVSQACSALATLAMLIQSELSEQDEDDAQIGMLCDAARILVRFIGGELDELQGAAGDIPNSANVQTMKGIELATLDDGEAIAVMGGAAVKAIGTDGWTNGYLVKFGGDGDLSNFRDVFTQGTNFGKHTKSDVWVHHRMLPGLGKKQLTNQAEIGIDDEGVFIKHLLDLRSSYESKLYGLVQAGKLGWSSGTAPHLVERKALGDGRHEITQWTLGLDASYTPMPAGGFVVNAGAMKSLLHDAGIDLLNAMYIDDSPEANEAKAIRHDGAEMDADTRARRLVLELDILQLETT